MILSVHLPHGGLDDNEGHQRAIDAMDVFIGGDINIELEWTPRVENIDWYGLHGPVCRWGGEDET